MEIRRCASRRSGAEVRTVVPERDPQLAWKPGTGRLVLRAEDNPDWKDGSTHYDYEVFLGPADLDQLRRLLLGREEPV